MIESSAVVVEGPDEDDWAKASDFINGLSAPQILFLSKEEVYFSQLASYDKEGLQYVWGVKRLTYNGDAGWEFSDWV